MWTESVYPLGFAPFPARFFDWAQQSSLAGWVLFCAEVRLVASNYRCNFVLTWTSYKPSYRGAVAEVSSVSWICVDAASRMKKMTKSASFKYIHTGTDQVTTRIDVTHYNWQEPRKEGCNHLQSVRSVRPDNLQRACKACYFVVMLEFLAPPLFPALTHWNQRGLVWMPL